jgi:hypothetical protein
VPADVDGDGFDEVLAVTEKERPGSIFGRLPVKFGSEISCYSLWEHLPPRLEWRLTIPVTGIVSGAVEREGRYNFLVQTRSPDGEGWSWQSLRMR